MKNKYILIEWIGVLIFLVLPPLLVNPGSSATIANNGEFSPYIFLRLIIAIFLYCQQIYVIKKSLGDKASRFRRLVLFCTWSALCLGLLMIVQALMQALAMVFPVNHEEIGFSSTFTALNYILLFINLFAGAFYEEVIYREFLPETLLLFTGERKIPGIIAESSCILIFALSHRYLGLMAVINALLGGIILRVCRKKSLSIWAGTAAHFLYNAILLLFAILGKN
ncbi:MAG: CPBP family intramembrane metalloprotease [Treponema sp.]|nr:CPBP family intramembrane metalloprotease [Treponema sp.]